MLLLRWQELLAPHQVFLPLPPLSRLGGNEQKGLAGWMPEFCKSSFIEIQLHLSFTSICDCMQATTSELSLVHKAEMFYYLTLNGKSLLTAVLDPGSLAPFGSEAWP